MSLSSEELFISQHYNSEGNSSINESLTAKLDNMLNSSDEIVVENTNLFMASSNDLTEHEEVHSLPHSENQSVPRLEIEERNRTKYKSGESYTSLGTVVRHETPKIGQKRVKIARLPRPTSAKPSRGASKSKNLTENQELSNILKKLAIKNPDYSQVIHKEKPDFEQVYEKKVKDMEKVLKNNIRKDPAIYQLKKKNRDKEKKREEIQVKFQEEELDRMRKSFTKFEENCKFKLKHMIDHTLKRYQNQKVVEDKKFAKEAQAKRKRQKQTIIENIKNFYDDKIQMFKEKINERRASKAIINYEHKQLNSEAEKTRRKEQKKHHEINKHLINVQLENTKIIMEHEEESACNKIIQVYKQSMKSIRKP